MKNKNIKNKTKNVVDGFSCVLDFPNFSGGVPPDTPPPHTHLINGIHQLNPQNLFSKFSGGGPPDPTYKGNTSIKPSKSFNNNSSQRQKKKKKKKKRGKPFPIKTIYKKFIFRLYRN